MLLRSEIYKLFRSILCQILPYHALGITENIVKDYTIKPLCFVKI